MYHIPFRSTNLKILKKWSFQFFVELSRSNRNQRNEQSSFDLSYIKSKAPGDNTQAEPGALSHRHITRSSIGGRNTHNYDNHGPISCSSNTVQQSIHSYLRHTTPTTSH